MAGGENSNFLRGPLAYIQQTAVDIIRFPVSVNGDLEVRGSAHDTWLKAHPEYSGAWHTVVFDLVKRTVRTSQGSQSVAIMRIERGSFTDAQQGTMGNDRWKAFYKSKHPITGYYFPYLSPPAAAESIRKGWGIADMGQVDFPRTDPAYDFIFTGAMNGCAIVITESPQGDGHYRIYHYPNVSTYPQFKPARLWPHTRLYVWTAEDYGGEGIDADAWNFLHYDRQARSWYLYCQPHTWVSTQVNRPGSFEMAAGCPVMTSRAKTYRAYNLPGRIPLAQLKTDFA
jgi:hypothetical protein